MPQHPQYQVALDLGSSVITTVVGGVDEYGGLHIYGVGRSPSAGIIAGEVTNVSRAAAAIRQSLDQAEAASGAQINQVGFSITGTHFESRNNRGAVALSIEDPINWEDMMRAEESGKAVTITPGSELIHAIPRHFVVDAERRCDDPRGQHGHRLDVDTHIVTGGSTAIRHAAACVANAGVKITLAAAKPVVGAVRAIRDEERRMGALVIGFDAGTTSVTAFEDGAISHTSVLKTGMLNVVSDLAKGLGCSADTATEIMSAHGFAHPLVAAEHEEAVALPSFSGGMKQVTRTEIAGYVYPRLNEMLTMVGQRVTEQQLHNAASGGIILTGGGAELRGVDQVIAKAFNVPVRIGGVGQLSGLSDQLDRPDAIGAVGMLAWLLDVSAQAHQPRRAAQRSSESSLLAAASSAISSFSRVFGTSA